MAYSSLNPQSAGAGIAIAVVSFFVAWIVANAVKVANQWERVVVLRLGRFRSLEGPGLFFIMPILDTVAYRIDIRVITGTFRAEKTMTRDTVPVDVDAVLFWKVVNPKMAALDVADYVSAINWAAQTALRDVIGKTMLADMLEGREKLSAELQRIIDARTEPWGVNVISVEVKDVQIPAALEDAMSMQAQAERERQARVILGDSERQVAEKFAEAAKTYADNPTAFHLRAMNMLYEGLNAATPRSSSCPRLRSSRCSSAACRRWRRSRAPSPMLRRRLPRHQRRRWSEGGGLGRNRRVGADQRLMLELRPQFRRNGMAEGGEVPFDLVRAKSRRG